MLNKDFAHKASIMISSRLIWYKHYYEWCNKIIENYDEPPLWIIELATVKYIPKAVEIVNSYAYSEPFDFLSSRHDLYLACLFLRYESRELSWATFLELAGNYSDGNSTKVDCEYFYYMLNDYEDSEFELSLERLNKEKVYNKFKVEIEEIRHHYKMFKWYFKEYINKYHLEINSNYE